MKIIQNMILGLLTVGLLYTPAQALEKGTNKDIAFNLTALFRAYRKTVSVKKDAIHKPSVYFADVDEKLKKMHKYAKQNYRLMTRTKLKTTGVEREMTLKLEQAVEKVIRAAAAGSLDLNWHGANDYVKKWDGKLLPARFAAAMAKEFNKSMKGKAVIKLTTSDKLLVNIENKPDAWENNIINTMLLNSTSKTGKPYSEMVGTKFRYILPEFYAPSCIGCHGTAAGQEGYKIHPSRIERTTKDFAGAISVILQK